METIDHDFTPLAPAPAADEQEARQPAADAPSEAPEPEAESEPEPQLGFLELLRSPADSAECAPEDATDRVLCRQRRSAWDY
ncbi:MAG: hypothetical protein J1E29_02510 [Duncaniella sp.]|nr:hypothetical protein [Duncaniella sp.]